CKAWRLTILQRWPLVYVKYTGIHAALLIVSLASLLYALDFGKPDCAIHISPQVGIAPLSLLHVRTTIESVADWRAARVTLYSDSGEVTSSDIQTDRRTTE